MIVISCVGRTLELMGNGLEGTEKSQTLRAAIDFSQQNSNLANRPSCRPAVKILKWLLRPEVKVKYHKNLITRRHHNTYSYQITPAVIANSHRAE